MSNYHEKDLGVYNKTLRWKFLVEQKLKVELFMAVQLYC